MLEGAHVSVVWEHVPLQTGAPPEGAGAFGAGGAGARGAAGAEGARDGGGPAALSALRAGAAGDGGAEQEEDARVPGGVVADRAGDAVGFYWGVRAYMDHDYVHRAGRGRRDRIDSYRHGDTKSERQFAEQSQSRIERGEQRSHATYSAWERREACHGADFAVGRGAGDCAAACRRAAAGGGGIEAYDGGCRAQRRLVSTGGRAGGHLAVLSGAEHFEHQGLVVWVGAGNGCECVGVGTGARGSV